MLTPGVLPAAVTPFDAKGRVDPAALARLLAWYGSNGCSGVVLAGTNGEGPSLSAVEKRDLLEAAQRLETPLETVLGIATPSLDEAVWLCKQAERFGARAALVMAPFYFRDAAPEGIERWFLELLERSPVPLLAYNFPQKAGVTLTPEVLASLARHERLLGAKDSSGERSNLGPFREALGPERQLFVGNETLLLEALAEGWTGTISGAANVLPQWLATVVGEWREGARDSAEAKFALALPAIESLRRGPQPALNKAVLVRMGVLPAAGVRLPLLPAALERVEETMAALRQSLGVGA